jgi:lysophospholipase L1-like esterase
MNRSILQKIRDGSIKRVHFHGDSITQGCGYVPQNFLYVSDVVEYFKHLSGHEDWRVYNHGVGGATVSEGLQRVHWCDRGNERAELTFLMFGLNDVNQGVPLTEFSENLRAFIRRLREIGSEVVVLGPTPFLGHVEEVRAFARTAQDMAREEQVAFINCLDLFYAGGAVAPDLLWPDGVHLTAKGQHFLGQFIVNAFKRACSENE